MARRDKKDRFRVIVPNGTEMVRLYHRNIVANSRALKDARVEVPPIRTRAKMVVRESREIVIKEQG